MGKKVNVGVILLIAVGLILVYMGFFAYGGTGLPNGGDGEKEFLISCDVEVSNPLAFLLSSGDSKIQSYSCVKQKLGFFDTFSMKTLGLFGSDTLSLEMQSGGNIIKTMGFKVGEGSRKTIHIEGKTKNTDYKLILRDDTKELIDTREGNV